MFSSEAGAKGTVTFQKDLSVPDNLPRMLWRICRLSCSGVPTRKTGPLRGELNGLHPDVHLGMPRLFATPENSAAAKLALWGGRGEH
jgi:hypothetical protein